MRICQLSLLAALLTATGPVLAFSIVPEANLGFRNEPGVETKEFLIAGASAAVPFFGFWGDIALSAGDNSGIAYYGLGAEAQLLRLQLRGQVNHNQWSSWRWGENSASLMLLAGPVRALDLGVGAAWRVPLLNPGAYWSPFHWQSPAREWNLLYHVQWSFIQFSLANLAVWIANDDPLTPHAPQQFPFGLRGSLKVIPHWWLNARVGSDIKGLSGALFSLGELDARIGMSYGR